VIIFPVLLMQVTFLRRHRLKPTDSAISDISQQIKMEFIMAKMLFGTPFLFLVLVLQIAFCLF
jgi:membrane protein insertase Oxa1/YidC/SpoIIIJ